MGSCLQDKDRSPSRVGHEVSIPENRLRPAKIGKLAYHLWMWFKRQKPKKPRYTHKNLLSSPAQSYGATVEKRCGRQNSSRTRTVAGWELYLQTEGNGSLNRVLIKPGSKIYERLGIPLPTPVSLPYSTACVCITFPAQVYSTGANIHFITLICKRKF